MTDIEKQFRQAVAKVRNAPADGGFRPSNEYKLKMYALYRQASDGDVSGKRPGMLDPVGRFKHDAWAAVRGMAREEAMRRYIAEVQKVEAEHG
jgi:acyl-CoA-binding protein